MPSMTGARYRIAAGRQARANLPRAATERKKASQGPPARNLQAARGKGEEGPAEGAAFCQGDTLPTPKTTNLGRLAGGPEAGRADRHACET
jgi:hypothetical protein